MNQPNTIAGAPAELQAIIDAHRARYAGMYMSAEGGEDGGAETPTDEKTDPAPKADPAPKGDEEAEDVSKLPKWAQATISNLRKEAGDARVNAKAAAADEARQKLAADVGKALGLVKDEGDKVDPEKLVADLSTAQADRAETQRQLAVFRLASKHGADPDALLDSNSFLASVRDIDPTDAEKIGAAIKDAVSNNSKLAAARAVGKSGNDSGGTGDAANKGDVSLHDSIAAELNARR